MMSLGRTGASHRSDGDIASAPDPESSGPRTADTRTGGQTAMREAALER